MNAMGRQARVASGRSSARPQISQTMSFPDRNDEIEWPFVGKGENVETSRSYETIVYRAVPWAIRS